MSRTEEGSADLASATDLKHGENEGLREQDERAFDLIRIMLIGRKWLWQQSAGVGANMIT